MIREATANDIVHMQYIRHAVRENRLSDPSKVTDEDVRNYLCNRGKGWVAEQDGHIIGFAIGDLVEANIWALFVLPEEEGHGIGRSLHDTMIHWMFAQGLEKIWLCTGPGTRAEAFYRQAGWIPDGLSSHGEIRFILPRTSIDFSIRN